MWRGTSCRYQKATFYSGNGLTLCYRFATTASNPNENVKGTSNLSFSSTLSANTNLLIIRTLLRILVYLTTMVIHPASSPTSLPLVEPATSAMALGGRKRILRLTPRDGHTSNQEKRMALLALNTQEWFGQPVMPPNMKQNTIRATIRT